MIGRLIRLAGRWLGNTWAEVKSSTDASLLGGARFLGLLYGPIDRRLRIDQALRKALAYRLPAHAGWRHALGGITYLLFIVLVVTGVLLSLYYRPSAQEAYHSIQHLVSQVSFGWLIRDLHVWSANLIVVAIMAHMARVFFDAAYKPPRETNWVVGLVLLGVVLAFGATGYLLPWDQWAYWTVTEVLNALARVPVIGPPVASALTGDVIVSGATLSRYFALHVVVLPWVAFALLAYHFTLIRRRGIAPPRGVAQAPKPAALTPEDTLSDLERKAPAEDEPERTPEGIPFFPNHLLRSLIVAVIGIAVVVSLAALYPRPVGDIANPYAIPDELVSTWVVVDVSLALIRFLGAWGLGLFTLLGLALVLLPLFDRGPERRLRQRPLVAALGVIFFVGFIAAWLAGRQIRSVPPSAATMPGLLEQEDRPPVPGLPIPAIGPTPLRPGAPPDTAGQDQGES